MLVISREEKEAFRIGDTVKVTVVQASNDKVELLVEAPQDVLVRVVDGSLDLKSAY